MLWAITAYFNPIGFRRRKENYRIFRKHLAAPLVTVECSFGRAFELASGDAEILIQIPEGDIMWQKERLLNVALASLPSEATEVAWLDCDIVFEDSDWPERAVRALRDNAIVQLYRERYHLPANAGPGEFDIASQKPAAISNAHLLGSGQIVPDALREAAVEAGRTNGLAWAGRRDLLDRHGLYDACIIGSGDRAILCAALGVFDVFEEALAMHPAQFEHYLKWAEPFHESAGGRAGALEGGVMHLWHGDIALRQYRTRHLMLAPMRFDPNRDIALTPAGTWRWNSDKPELHRLIRDFFENRNEDGLRDAAPKPVRS